MPITTGTHASSLPAQSLPSIQCSKAVTRILSPGSGAAQLHASLKPLPDDPAYRSVSAALVPAHAVRAPFSFITSKILFTCSNAWGATGEQECFGSSGIFTASISSISAVPFVRHAEPAGDNARSYPSALTMPVETGVPPVTNATNPAASSAHGTCALV